MIEADSSLGRVIIFAGAGSSFATSSAKYPTTAGFVERFPQGLRSDSLIGHLTSHFESKFGEATPDVEKILWCLEELLSFCELTQDPKSPVSWVVPNNALPSLVGSSASSNQFAQVAKAAVGRIRTLRDQINAQLYDIYGEVPTQQEIATWSRLLVALGKQGYWLDLITTNYDLVLETVVDHLSLGVGYGLSRGAIPRLDLSKWRDFLTQGSSPYEGGLITKLHGSLNWERDKRGVVFSGTGFKSDHRHHAAIYPGFKGTPKDEPFNLFHDYFERVLQDATHIIFIGFAFRDDYINTLLRRSSHSGQFIAIDPSGLSNLPQDLKGRIHHLKTGFNAEAVDKLLYLIGAHNPRS